MTVRVGINGFGRIGRSFYRAILAKGANAGIEMVAVNDPFGDSETMAFLLKHDSVGGVLSNEGKVSDGGFSVDGNEVRKLESKDPAEIPWGEYNVEDVNAAFAEAAGAASYRGVLQYTEEPLVSADIVANPASCIFSAPDTMVSGRMVKILGWYDNEWGYSNRLVDLAAFIAK